MFDLEREGTRYKRPFDLTVLIGVHLFPLLTPVWLLIWVLIPLIIWMEDRGPVFYRQNRIGKDGRVFTVLKFRTMVTDADRRGPVWNDENDPRVTKVGRILRRTALDELPEILSILKGDMTFVGPRALAVEEQQYLEGQIPGFEQRLKVRPGLTGLAQVYNLTDDADLKLKYDLEYIKNMGPLLDVKLMLMSVRNTVLARWDRRTGK